MYLDNKKRLYGILAIVFSILSLGALIFLIYTNNFSDDAVARKNNVPETGWVTIYLTLITVPILVFLIALAVSFAVMWRVTKSRDEGSAVTRDVTDTARPNDTSATNDNGKE